MSASLRKKALSKTFSLPELITAGKLMEISENQSLLMGRGDVPTETSANRVDAQNKKFDHRRQPSRGRGRGRGRSTYESKPESRETRSRNCFSCGENYLHQDGFMQRLEDYKLKKQEEKLKRKQELEQQKILKGAKRQNEISGKSEPFAKKRKTDSYQVSMREKLLQWRTQKDSTQSDRRNTIAFGHTVQNEKGQTCQPLPAERRQTISAKDRQRKTSEQIVPHRNKVMPKIRTNTVEPATKSYTAASYSSRKPLSVIKPKVIPRTTSAPPPKSRKSLFGSERTKPSRVAEKKETVSLSSVTVQQKLLKNVSSDSSNPDDQNLRNNKDALRTPGKKFTHVKSRIDTGLNVKSSVVKNSNEKQEKNKGVGQANKTTATLAINNLNRPVGKKPFVKSSNGHLNIPCKQREPLSVNTQKRNNQRETFSTKEKNVPLGITRKSLSNPGTVRQERKRNFSASGTNATNNNRKPIDKTNIQQRKSVSCIPTGKTNVQQKNSTSSVTTGNQGLSTNIKRRKSCLSTSTKRSTVETKLRKVVSDSDNEAVGSVTQIRNQVHFLTPKSKPFSPAMKGALKQTPVRSIVMRDRLNDWLKSKGKTPSRFKHLMCFHDDKQSNENVRGGLSVNELQLQQEHLELELQDDSVFEESMNDSHGRKLENLLSECLLLLQSGCPVENVAAWLGEIEKSSPSTSTEAKYYILRSRIAEDQGKDDAEVIDIFEEAVRNNASPPDEVANALTEFVGRMNSRKEKKKSPQTPSYVTPRKRRSVNKENVIPSSTLKYSLSKTTPFFTRLRAKADGQPTPCGIVTPVRRSARLSKTPLPSALQDHDTVLETLEDLSPDTRINFLFQPNKALTDDFEAVANESLLDAIVNVS